MSSYGGDPNWSKPGGTPPPPPPPPSGYPSPPTPYAPGASYPQYGYAPVAQPNPFDSKATGTLVLGILSLVICGLLGPFAWSMGSRLKKEAAAAGYPEPGQCKAGRICGMIATILVGVGIALFVLFIVIGVATSPPN